MRSLALLKAADDKTFLIVVFGRTDKGENCNGDD